MNYKKNSIFDDESVYSDTRDKKKNRKFKYRRRKIYGKVIDRGFSVGEMDTILSNEIDSFFSKNILRRHVRKRKIRKGNVLVVKDDSSDFIYDTKEDREITHENDPAIAIIVLILVGCFVVGTLIGYILYHLAMNNS